MFDLARKMSLLPEPPARSRPPYWDYWRHDLWVRAQGEPPEMFANWPCVYHTMLVNHFKRDVRQQYYALPEEWRMLCRPPKVGDKDWFRDTNLSMNMINQAHHLWVYEKASGKKIKNLRTVVEFGGGFGAMALLVNRAGFKGKYFIIDFPEFRLLQDWFLSKHGVSVEKTSDTALVGADLFMGVYSISEVDPRSRIEYLLGQKSYLLLYSSNFAEYDNIAYFKEFSRNRTDLLWHTEQLSERPDYYMVGWKDDNYQPV
jgi:hypothetical protein